MHFYIAGMPYPACALTVTKRKGPFCNLIFLEKKICTELSVTENMTSKQNALGDRIIMDFSYYLLPARMKNSRKDG